jgi:hypothetical protein
VGRRTIIDVRCVQIVIIDDVWRLQITDIDIRRGRIGTIAVGQI